MKAGISAKKRNRNPPLASNVAQVFYGIAAFSTAYNLPRFVELEVSYHNETTLHTINDTGIPQLDYVIEFVSELRGYLVKLQLSVNEAY